METYNLQVADNPLNASLANVFLVNAFVRIISLERLEHPANAFFLIYLTPSSIVSLVIFLFLVNDLAAMMTTLNVTLSTVIVEGTLMVFDLPS